MMMVMVQTELDGVWRQHGGSAVHWRQRLKSKQDEIRRERANLLRTLGGIYLNELSRPRDAARALATSLDDVPLYVEPLGEVIADVWPVCSDVKKKWFGRNVQDYANVLRDLSRVYERLDHLDAAIDAQTRALLASFINGWHYRDSTAGENARRLWALIGKLPPDTPRPMLFWLNVLTPENPTVTFTMPSGWPSYDVRSHYHPMVAIDPAGELDTLDVTAEMEGLGGGGEVRLYTVEGKHQTLGVLPCSRFGLKGRERRTKTFRIPPGTGIIQFHAHVKHFRIPTVHVKACFRGE